MEKWRNGENILNHASKHLQRAQSKSDDIRPIRCSYITTLQRS